MSLTRCRRRFAKQGEDCFVYFFAVEERGRSRVKARRHGAELCFFPSWPKWGFGQGSHVGETLFQGGWMGEVQGEHCGGRAQTSQALTPPAQPSCPPEARSQSLTLGARVENWIAVSGSALARTITGLPFPGPHWPGR